MKTIQYPAGVQIEITPKCNHNCVHCYNFWRANDDPVDNPLDDMSEIAEKVVDLYPTHVTITGGEPLLRFEEVKKIVEIMKKSVCTHVSINTNAALVNDEIAAFFAVNDISAFVSLPCGDAMICDKITSTKGSFAKIIRGIKILVEHNVRVAVNMVVSKINKDKVYDTAQYVYKELNVTNFFASPVSRPVNASDDFEKYMLSSEDLCELADVLILISEDFGIKTEFSVSLPYCSFVTQKQSDRFSYRKHCTAGKFAYAVDYTGNVKACPRDDKKYGNILTENFTDIWARMEEWRDDSLIPIECKKCESKQVCGGGCRLEGYSGSHARNQLDMRANLEFAPLKFKRKVPNYLYEDGQRFKVNPGMHRITEDVGVRINVGTEFLYITPKLSDFLSERKTVTLLDMLKIFSGASKEETKMLISYLIKLMVLIPE